MFKMALEKRKRGKKEKEAIPDMKGTCSPSAKYCYVSNSEKTKQTNEKSIPSFFFPFFVFYLKNNLLCSFCYTVLRSSSTS